MATKSGFKYILGHPLDPVDKEHLEAPGRAEPVIELVQKEAVENISLAEDD